MSTHESSCFLALALFLLRLCYNVDLTHSRQSEASDGNILELSALNGPHLTAADGFWLGVSKALLVLMIKPQLCFYFKCWSTNVATSLCFFSGRRLKALWRLRAESSPNTSLISQLCRLLLLSLPRAQPLPLSTQWRLRQDRAPWLREWLTDTKKKKASATLSHTAACFLLFYF